MPIELNRVIVNYACGKAAINSSSMVLFYNSVFHYMEITDEHSPVPFRIANDCVFIPNLFVSHPLTNDAVTIRFNLSKYGLIEESMVSNLVGINIKTNTQLRNSIFLRIEILKLLIADRFIHDKLFQQKHTLIVGGAYYGKDLIYDSTPVSINANNSFDITTISFS